MKKTVVILIALALVCGGIYWFRARPGAAPPNASAADGKPDEDDAGGTKVSRDDKGNAIITMSDDTQGDNGIVVARVQAIQLTREIMGYGHVLDPAPLAALCTELASAKAAAAVSSNELERVKTLSSQGNVSARTFQTAEAAAARDQLAVQSVRDRLALGWGQPLADLTDSSGLLRSLISLTNFLVRVDLPASEPVQSATGNARIVPLAGSSCVGVFLGAAPNVDPQNQGRGYIFLVTSNTAGLAPAESVLGYIGIGGEVLPGVIVPTSAVVRTEGGGWVYVLQGNGEDFMRVSIPLDRPADNGWFVAGSLTGSNYVVVTGAQTLLSEELKGAAAPD